jgi:hypothetical protein
MSYALMAATATSIGISKPKVGIKMAPIPKPGNTISPEAAKATDATKTSAKA